MNSGGNSVCMSLLICRKWARRAPSRFQCYVLPRSTLVSTETRQKNINNVLFASILWFYNLRLSSREGAETNSRNDRARTNQVIKNILVWICEHWRHKRWNFGFFWSRLCNNTPQLHLPSLPPLPHTGMRSQDFGNQVSCPGNSTPSSEVGIRVWVFWVRFLCRARLSGRLGRVGPGCRLDGLDPK